MAVTAGCCGGGDGEWDCSQLGSCSVTDVGDVDTTTTPPSPGDTLVWDGTNWVPGPPGAWDCEQLAGCSIDNLGDADTSTTPPQPGQHLEWDGTNWVPADTAPLTTGCGLIGAGTTADPATVNTSGVWGSGGLDFPCDESNGQEIYCDSAGQLRTVPEKIYAQELVSEPGAQDLPAPPDGGRVEVYDLQLSFTNPSDCRDMMATFTMGTSALEFTMSPGNFWAMQWGFTATTDGTEPPFPEELNGGTLNSYRHSERALGAVTIGFTGYSTELPMAAYTGQPTIPPGETVRVRVRLSLGSTFTNVDPADDETPRWSRPNLMLTAQGWSV